MLVLSGPSKDTVLSPQGPHPWPSPSSPLHALYSAVAPHTCLAERAFCGTIWGSSAGEAAGYRGLELGQGDSVVRVAPPPPSALRWPRSNSGKDGEPFFNSVQQPRSPGKSTTPVLQEAAET